MKKALLISLFCICSLTAFSQSAASRVKLPGVVLSAENKQGAAYVQILNKSTMQGDLADSLGRFSVNIGLNDSIQFSSLGYETLVLIVSDEILKKEYLTISLKPRIYQLRPVDIYAYKTEEEFKRQILETKVSPSVKPYTPPTPKYAPTGGGIVITGPVTALYNTFSKQAKFDKKLQEQLQQYNRQKLVQSKFNSQIAQNITGLEGEMLEKFMKHCKLSDEFVEKATEYEIVLAINSCFKEFSEMN